MFFLIFSGTSPLTTTSDTANRPPGLSTRKASLSTRSLSPERLITQFEMMTSTALSGRGMFSISPFRNSTLVNPLFRLFSSEGLASRRSYRGHRPYHSERHAERIVGHRFRRPNRGQARLHRLLVQPEPWDYRNPERR